MTIKSSSSLWYWHVLSLVCPQPWNTTWHCFYPMDPKARAKIAGIVNKFYRCIFSFQGVGKNKIADRFLHLLNRPREYIQLHRYKAVYKVIIADARQTLVKVTRCSSFLRLNVTDNRLALSSARHRREGIKHFQSKLTYKTREIRPSQKSPLHC